MDGFGFESNTNYPSKFNYITQGLLETLWEYFGPHVSLVSWSSMLKVINNGHMVTFKYKHFRSTDIAHHTSSERLKISQFEISLPPFLLIIWQDFTERRVLMMNIENSSLFWQNWWNLNEDLLWRLITEIPMSAVRRNLIGK